MALSDTNNLVAIDQLRAHLKGEYEIELRLAGESEIERAIEHYYGHEFSIDGILKEIETGEVDYTTIVEGDEYSQPVVRLISALLADAVERGGSDIHFEPEQNFLRIRYRIDGVLRQIRSLHKTYWPAMAVRIKVMAKMNIAETRAAGWAHFGDDVGTGGGFPRGQPADHARRKPGAADPRPPERHRAARSARPGRGAARASPAHDRAAGRDHSGDRADRQRQDHHALFDPEPHQFRRRERHDARRSGRVSDDADPPDFGVRGVQA